MVRAAVFHEVGQEKAEILDSVEVLGPNRGEVRVRIRATGLCHSDLSAMAGVLPQPPPCVLGHEGAGEVVAVGEGVDDVSVGDRVIVCWIPACGRCRSCLRGESHLCLELTVASIRNPRFRVGETPYFGLAGTGTFAEELTLPRQAVVDLPADVPFEVGALVGCGVMTGVGSVLNVAEVEAGSSVAVIGCGGVGISVIQGARIAGATEIVAVDVVASKLQWAREFGATHAVAADDATALKDELTGGEGFDYVFEVVGSGATIRTAYDLTRRGGTTVVVGVGSASDSVTFSPFELFFTDRTIKASYFGRADVRTDYARMIRLWRTGQLDLERMITRRISLDELNGAIDALRAGEVIRQVIIFD